MGLTIELPDLIHLGSVMSRDDNFTRTRRIPTRMDKKVFCPLKFGLGSSKPKIKKSGSSLPENRRKATELPTEIFRR